MLKCVCKCETETFVQNLTQATDSFFSEQKLKAYPFLRGPTQFFGNFFICGPIRTKFAQYM